jgi:hypothetical protein
MRRIAISQKARYRLPKGATKTYRSLVELTGEMAIPARLQPVELLSDEHPCQREI